jgi:hypothetical protein
MEPANQIRGIDFLPKWSCFIIFIHIKGSLIVLTYYENTTI